MTQMTPAQVLERRRELLLNQDTDGFVGPVRAGRRDRAAVRGSGPARPARWPAGHPRLLQPHGGLALRIDDLETVALHHTSDPEVVIVELLSRVTLATTGRRLAVRSIQVFRIRDGKIVLFRDYFNPNGLADALGA